MNWYVIPHKNKGTRLGAFASLFAWELVTRTTNEFFFDASGFTRAFAQIVQFSTTHSATTLDFDAGDLRGIKLECTLNSFARRNLANDERRVQTTIATADNHAFVSLDTLTRTFNHVYVHNNGVTRTELGRQFATGQALDFFLLKNSDQIHD